MFNLTRTIISRQSSRMLSTFETLKVTTPKAFVAHVELNRPDRLNALNYTLWHEIGQCFDELNASEDVRSIVLTGAGKHFTAGIDLMDMLQIGQKLAGVTDVSRKAKVLEELIVHHQNSISSLERCLKPVIAATHSAVVGAGVDLISTADIRYCTKDCWFSIKEVDIGMAADVGTLQRFPKAIGSQSLVRELCFTGRKFKSDEALRWGFVTRVFDTKEELVEASLKLAEEIASKSPVAVQGTKKNLVYSLDHTNQEGLDQITEINKMNLQSEDFVNAVMAGQSKGEVPVFSKL
ncbi:delta(3,5)-Delta(2,4)-dienoyl-CoA isomerase, mitochondrial [Chironomus tepperi]|uniref:delta(3,5)-Delta(2,4)-dienoyl-CoA isomerase, mitochondrial n=1 Tax=Chironomus tepperi TaxID=113505 RepID=UPI00391FA6C0